MRSVLLVFQWESARNGGLVFGKCCVGDRLAAFKNVHIDVVPVETTWERLKANPKAVLIDVRTKAEWAFVGLPDLSQLGRRAVTVEWQTFPDSRVDAQFVARLSESLQASGASTSDELFFICRSGGRSQMAAEAMAEAGYEHCHNVAEGFEGPLDDHRQRGKVAGWKAAGLPWVQG